MSAAASLGVGSDGVTLNFVNHSSHFELYRFLAASRNGNEGGCFALLLMGLNLTSAVCPARGGVGAGVRSYCFVLLRVKGAGWGSSFSAADSFFRAVETELEW